jgi:hypothetical protein
VEAMGQREKLERKRRCVLVIYKIAEISTRDSETKRDALAERKHPEAKVNRFFSSTSN